MSLSTLMDVFNRPVSCADVLTLPVGSFLRTMNTPGGSFGTAAFAYGISPLGTLWTACCQPQNASSLLLWAAASVYVVPAFFEAYAILSEREYAPSSPAPRSSSPTLPVLSPSEA